MTVQIQTAATYHLEYYEPMSRTGDERKFTYLWPGDYSIDDISISVRVPPDTTRISTDPEMKSTKGADGGAYLDQRLWAAGRRPTVPPAANLYEDFQCLRRTAGKCAAIQATGFDDTGARDAQQLFAVHTRCAWHRAGRGGLHLLPAGKPQPPTPQAAIAFEAGRRRDKERGLLSSVRGEGRAGRSFLPCLRDQVKSGGMKKSR